MYVLLYCCTRASITGCRLAKSQAYFFVYEDVPHTISRQLESTASTCEASPNPTMGTAECMNSVRSWARVGAAPKASPDSEALAITPPAPEICTASVFAEDANRTQAGGRLIAP